MSTPIVLVGGLTVHRPEWEPTLRAIAQIYGVSITDLLTEDAYGQKLNTEEQSGHKPSDLPQITFVERVPLCGKCIPKPWPIPEKWRGAVMGPWEAELMHVRRHVEAAGQGKPVILVGHSVGAILVEGLARLHPELVAQLVLIDGSSPIGLNGKPPRSPAQFKTVGPSLLARWATQLPPKAAIALGKIVMKRVCQIRGEDPETIQKVLQYYQHPNGMWQALGEITQEQSWVSKVQDMVSTHPLTMPVWVVVAPGRTHLSSALQRWWVALQSRRMALNPGKTHIVQVIKSDHMVMWTRGEHLGWLLHRLVRLTNSTQS
ncbi:hypothetical protein BK816_08815 [Boudabousia tangfeifanii]|uniref:AB hydrolase-1 domain-containing protein n=2 Tax=Boudabousia tangfeifanii TaxID=1912795 RepID=A0A1D9MM87_9ACTO|nr:hypothetical protein BK816_08815 [Boudabousia tangfeifanii]